MGRIGDVSSGGVGFSDNFSAGVTVEKKTGTVSVTAATVDGFINSLNRNDGEQPAFSRQSVKAAVDNLKVQQAQQGGAKTAVYQVIKGENGKEKFIGLDKDGNLTMQDVGKSSRPGPKGPVQTQIVLSEKAKELILQSESAKFTQEQTGKAEAALKEVTVGGKQFLLAVDKEGNSYKSEVQMSAPKKGKSFSAGAFLKSPPKLDEKFQSVVIEASINKLQEQRAGGATGDLVKALEYNGMNKLVALRTDGKAETIDFSAYKAKSGAEAIAVDKAIQELREWQAANPGQEASKKIKINKKISFNITLNADGSIKDIKRKKKKKQGFFAKIGSFFKKALQVLSIATMFIPGLQPIALGLRIANAVVGVVDAVRNNNILGALGSFAGAFGGSLANTITRTINTASTVVNVARNGLGNAWNAISTVAGTVSSWAGGAIGRVTGYISQGASAISSFARGDGWNGAIALGNLAGSVYQDSRAANQRQQASSNRDTQNDQVMISLDQPLLGTAPVDRVQQAYEGIYGRMNDRQNAALQLAVQNANRRGITDTVGVQNYVNQTLNLLSDNRNLSNFIAANGNRNTTSWVNQLSAALDNRNNPVLISGNPSDLRGLNRGGGYARPAAVRALVDQRLSEATQGRIKSLLSLLKDYNTTTGRGRELASLAARVLVNSTQNPDINSLLDLLTPNEQRALANHINRTRPIGPQFPIGPQQPDYSRQIEALRELVSAEKFLGYGVSADHTGRVGGMIVDVNDGLTGGFGGGGGAAVAPRGTTGNRRVATPRGTTGNRGTTIPRDPLTSINNRGGLIQNSLQRVGTDSQGRPMLAQTQTVRFTPSVLAQTYARNGFTTKLIPSGKDFDAFFNKQTPQDLRNLYDFKYGDTYPYRATISARLRDGGGKHEFLMVSEAPKIRELGFKSETIKKWTIDIQGNPIVFKTLPTDAGRITPGSSAEGRHSNDSIGNLAHRDLASVIQSSTSKEDFARRFVVWANERVVGGVNGSNIPAEMRAEFKRLGVKF